MLSFADPQPHMIDSLPFSFLGLMLLSIRYASCSCSVHRCTYVFICLLPSVHPMYLQSKASGSFGANKVARECLNQWRLCFFLMSALSKQRSIIFCTPLCCIGICIIFRFSPSQTYAESSSLQGCTPSHAT